MSVEEIKADVRRSFEAMNSGRAACLAEIDRACAPNVVIHSSSGMEYGLEGYKKLMIQYFDAFPDLHATIDDMFVEGDKAVVRYTLTGTHKGAFMGIPPTNKSTTSWAIDIYHLAGGKLVECWTRSDTLGAMQQLGAIPTQKK